jgi:hypothetical protein
MFHFVNLALRHAARKIFDVMLRVLNRGSQSFELKIFRAKIKKKFFNINILFLKIYINIEILKKLAMGQLYPCQSIGSALDSRIYFFS